MLITKVDVVVAQAVDVVDGDYNNNRLRNNTIQIFVGDIINDVCTKLHINHLDTNIEEFIRKIKSYDVDIYFAVFCYHTLDELQSKSHGPYPYFGTWGYVRSTLSCLYAFKYSDEYTSTQYMTNFINNIAYNLRTDGENLAIKENYNIAYYLDVDFKYKSSLLQYDDSNDSETNKTIFLKLKDVTISMQCFIDNMLNLHKRYDEHMYKLRSSDQSKFI